jgi:hypothetical protein
MAKVAAASKAGRFGNSVSTSWLAEVLQPGLIIREAELSLKMPT